MAEKTSLWYLENFNVFKELPKASLVELGKLTSMQDFPKNTPIYFAKEPSTSIFFLKKGRVKLTRTAPDGRELIISLINPGDVFGELSLFDGQEHTDYAIAMEPTLICAISREEFRKFVEGNPQLNRRINKLIGLRLRRYSERIEELVFKDAPQRVASFILRIAEDNGMPVGSEIFVKPFLTHEDIAKLTACSRQTVNTVLTGLREQRIIDFDRKKLIVRDHKRLADVSGQ